MANPTSPTRRRRLPAYLLRLAAATALGASGLIAAVSSPAAASPVTISNGVQNPDQNGNNIQGHGGSIIKVGSTFYWFGEDKTSESSANTSFIAIPCYSSTDLAHWTWIREALVRQPSGDLGPNRIVERPKVIYNSGTHQYVMYMHIDNASYSEAKVGVATSPSVCGPYTYRGSFQPLGFQSRDIGLFQDTNGSAYLLSEDRANGLRIDALSSDYLSVTSSVAVLSDYEAPAMFKVGGRYFLLGSHETGWAPNDNQYVTATSLNGPWSSWQDFAPAGTNTFSSQTDQVLTIQGTAGTTYMYMGDRWNTSNLGASTYVWLPLTVSGSSVSMPADYNSWTLDASAGTWSPGGGSSATELVSAQSGRCLDDPDASGTPGTQLDIWDCHHGQNQEFTYQGGTLRYLGNYCLDVFGNSAARGTKVDVYTCNGGVNQQWTMNGNGTITANNTGFCLDVVGQNTANGARVDVWTCNGQTNQQWAKA